jgi:membrane-bound acyltransferase YfiQ involved in biofilm formation
MIPEMSWLTIDLLLQFQPTSLILYITCFILGVVASSREWFAGDEFPQRLFIWVLTGLLLTAGFFIIGRVVFAHPATSDQLSSVLLLAFSFIRTLLCLAVLVILIAYARRYWNRPSGLNQALAANSYNIYLVHIFFVTALQDILMVWPGGPAMVKAAIVFLVALPISYGISRLSQTIVDFDYDRAKDVLPIPDNYRMEAGNMVGKKGRKEKASCLVL